jgi:hypothetical protein
MEHIKLVYLNDPRRETRTAPEIVGRCWFTARSRACLSSRCADRRSRARLSRAMRTAAALAR